jgi:hypothetical protein
VREKKTAPISGQFLQAHFLNHFFNQELRGRREYQPS